MQCLLQLSSSITSFYGQFVKVRLRRTPNAEPGAEHAERDAEHAERRRMTPNGSQTGLYSSTLLE